MTFTSTPIALPETTSFPAVQWAHLYTTGDIYKNPGTGNNPCDVDGIFVLMNYVRGTLTADGILFLVEVTGTQAIVREAFNLRQASLSHVTSFIPVNRKLMHLHDTDFIRRALPEPILKIVDLHECLGALS